MISLLVFVFKIIRPIIFSTVKKVTFPQSRKFSAIKKISQNQGNFLQSTFSANKDQKGSLKAKLLYPFNSKYYGKIFLAL